MPVFPRKLPKLLVRIDRHGRVTPADRRDESDQWWQSVLTDPKADTPRPKYGLESLDAMAGMLFGIRCDRCRKHANYLTDDLIKMFGPGMSARTAAHEFADCNRRSIGCYIRYVALPMPEKGT